ncbi:MAG TPA: hypothetical protein VHW46_16910 [Terracidiphilus sp.]|jgi:hypothetical protein|nr:hypothetical protein [Terracidiphilus sp.]
MNRGITRLALLLSIAGAHALAQSSNQSPAMSPPPLPDTSRIQDEMHHAAAPAGPLKITFGEKATEWTSASLAALPHTTITVYNEHAKANQTFSGVPLTDLLTPMGVPAKPRGKDFRLYVVAEGSDGYQVVYSIGEITPDVHDGTVLVADQIDGRSLGNNGMFQLVATGEKRPARWVRNLVGIRVLTAQ